jgi:hypothetical protein
VGGTGRCLKTHRGTEILARIPSPSIPLPKGEGSGKTTHALLLSLWERDGVRACRTRGSPNRSTIRSSSRSLRQCWNGCPTNRGHQIPELEYGALLADRTGHLPYRWVWRHHRAVSRINQTDGQLAHGGVRRRNVGTSIVTIYVPPPQWLRPATDVGWRRPKAVKPLLVRTHRIVNPHVAPVTVGQP